MSTLLHVFAPVQLDEYLTMLEAVDLTVGTPMSATSDDAGLPLDEYLLAQASWYRAMEQMADEANDVCTLAACTIERIARSVRFHGVRSVTELLAASPLYRNADLDQIETPGERPLSWLAEGLDRECEGYLLHDGSAARLIAWALLDAAEDADFFHADTVDQLRSAQAAWEAACEADADELGF